MQLYIGDAAEYPHLGIMLRSVILKYVNNHENTPNH